MRVLVAIILLCGWTNILWAKALVVSTHPLFLIAQEVTKDIEQPTLLLTPQQTGHDVQLTPKARQLVQDADLVIWLGVQHEAPLQRILNNQPNAIALLDSSIIQTLPLRDIKGQAITDSVDTHVWLEPNNAVRIAFFIAALRSQQEPQNKAKYWQNAQNFSKRMYDATKVAASAKGDRYYWAYHDAYQYLERALQLKFAGALSVDHDLAPTAAQMKYLMQNRPKQNMCLLAEYHADASVINRLAPVTNIPVDEALSDQKDFVTAWLKLANSIQQCYR